MEFLVLLSSMASFSAEPSKHRTEPRDGSFLVYLFLGILQLLDDEGFLSSAKRRRPNAPDLAKLCRSAKKLSDAWPKMPSEHSSAFNRSQALQVKRF